MKNEREIKYEIVNEIGVISEEGQWRLELNRVSWNGENPNTTCGNGRSTTRRWAKVLRLRMTNW